jgi:transketolase
MKNVKDIRDIFFNNIKDLFKRDSSFYILTNDADVHALKNLRSHSRFIDAGVAEQNLINIASGISSNKNTALIYGFCTFLSFRCYEQLKFSLASHKSNTKIVGIGPGYSFSNDGPTHHGIQDLYLMYLIPEMEIINVSDNNLAYIVSKKIKSIKGPTYIRLDKGVQDYNSKINYNLKDGFNFTIEKKNKQKLIISSGYFSNLANEVAEKRSDTSVVNIFRLKNFNRKKFVKNVKEFKKIIIYDESTISGGITPIILNVLNNLDLKKKVKILASPDKQLFRYSLIRDDILKHLKIDKSYLEKLI